MQTNKEATNYQMVSLFIETFTFAMIISSHIAEEMTYIPFVPILLKYYNSVHKILTLIQLKFRTYLWTPSL